MKLIVKYEDLAWWFWLVITLGIGVGLAGWREGYYVSTAVSGFNLLYYIFHDRSLTSLSVQVRIVWLAFMLVALCPPLWWMFIPLFLGMILVVLFDRCGIARVLIKMPWNKDVKLS